MLKKELQSLDASCEESYEELEIINRPEPVTAVIQIRSDNHT
jgi:hypothetical protein